MKKSHKTRNAISLSMTTLGTALLVACGPSEAEMTELDNKIAALEAQVEAKKAADAIPQNIPEGCATPADYKAAFGSEKTFKVLNTRDWRDNYSSNSKFAADLKAASLEENLTLPAKILIWEEKGLHHGRQSNEEADMMASFKTARSLSDNEAIMSYFDHVIHVTEIAANPDTVAYPASSYWRNPHFQDASKINASGFCILHVTVESSFEFKDVEASYCTDDRFQNLAIDHVKTWQFNVGKDENGKDISSRIPVRLNFDIKDKCGKLIPG